MLKYSSKRLCPSGMFAGMVVGIVIGLLLTGSGVSRSGTPSDATPTSPAAVARLNFAEIARLPKSTLSCMCEEAATAAMSGAAATENIKQRSLGGESAILAGVINTRRLLPIAKKLAIKALLALGEQNKVPAQDLPRIQRMIKGVDRVILDGALGDAAAVRDDRPTEIRIGSGYAETLISDDEAVFLLGHELTHVAARTGGLDGFIEHISQTAKLAADVEVRGDQEEDLACDFVGSQVLKQFIDFSPNSESKAKRLLRTCGYDLPSERLERAWGDFCASYSGYKGDTTHLSQGLTVRALASLDPELKEFIDRSSTATAISRSDH